MNKLESNLKQMYSEFTEEQKKWFRFEFPVAVHDWLTGEFDGKQLSKNPLLIEDYLNNVSLSGSKVDLDDLLLALWCVRKCYGPIKAPTLYRLTTFENSKNASTAIVRNKNQLKPITSWSVNPKVKVADRKRTPHDHILKAKIDPKYILSSTSILLQACSIVYDSYDDANDYFELSLDSKGRNRKDKGYDNGSKAASLWANLYSTLNFYKREEEYFVYLNSNDSIKVEVIRK